MGEIEKLAHEIDKWWEDYDHYGYNDAFSGEEEGYMAVIDGLYNYPDDLCEQLQDSIDSLFELDGTVDPFNQDLYDRGIALIDRVRALQRTESVKSMKPQRRLKEASYPKKVYYPVIKSALLYGPKYSYVGKGYDFVEDAIVEASINGWDGISIEENKSSVDVHPYTEYMSLEEAQKYFNVYVRKKYFASEDELKDFLEQNPDWDYGYLKDYQRFVAYKVSHHSTESVKFMKPQRRLKESVGREPLRAWIGNLGKYNEGELVGEWVDLPVSKADYDAVLKKIGIGSADDFGNPYEEIFVADYDDPYGFIYDHFGEYPNMIELNAFAKALDDLSDSELELVNAMAEAGIDSGDDVIWEYIGNAIDGNCFLVEGDTWGEFAQNWIDEVDGGVEYLPRGVIEDNFDYEALGRDLGFESYPDPDEYGNDLSAGEYWCGDKDATDQEIGEAYVEAVGFDGVGNPENYFDYDSYGREFQYDEFEMTKDGVLVHYNFDSSLGDDYKEKYEDEIRSDWGEDLEESLKESSAYDYFDDAHMGYNPGCFDYKGYVIEPSPANFLDGKYIVNYAGDEIVCDSFEDARKTVDELVEYNEKRYGSKREVKEATQNPDDRYSSWFSNYIIKFEDGYELIVLGSLEDVLFAVDERIAKHGECIECLKEISYDRYTGSKYEKVW